MYFRQNRPFLSDALLVQLLSLTLPFFILVGLGYASRRLGWLPKDGVRSINVFVFYFAVPALTINALAKQQFQTLVDLPYLAGWALAGILLYAIGAAIAWKFFDGQPQEMALFGQAASVGNLGFLALPLLIVVVGEEVAAPIAAALVVDLVLIIPLSIAIIESANSTGKGFVEAFAASCRGAILNPFFLAITTGVTISALGLELALPIERFISFLAGAAGPAALFSLGASLAGRSIAGDAAAIAWLNLLKLLVHPILAFFILTWFGVEGLFLQIGVVIAAMPIAGNVFVIAQNYGLMVRRLSAAILISTVAAVVTVALTLQFMGLAQERLTV